ncbi:bifunctional diguanylate cyclase/phosphodiesterase [Pseudoalteromonas rubra]|uniref:bifunctional diguanylate cyclase/phosphodiesterase n=1 Tax=Pseudoalteromonas rubra TaxID=43658 RepID=UPI00069641F6|nr:EAL domain-containing protein [Pseudoalteromonas rubra]
MKQFTYQDTITKAQAKQCAAEQIQHIGSIQPYGFVLVIDAHSDAVVMYSDNLTELLSIDRTIEVLATSVCDWIGETDLATIVASHTQQQICFKGTALIDHQQWECIASRNGEYIILEFFPVCGEDESLYILSNLDKMIAHVRASRTADELVKVVAEEFQRHTEYDRVMIYRFLPDFSGEVVAEAVSQRAQKRFLGMRFPAEDIPKQARELYKKNALRVMADVDAQPVDLIPAKLPDGQPLDQSLSVLRNMSPMHVAYLKNMGVKASLSIGLLHEGELWGLIACHHNTSKLPPSHLISQTKISCELFAEIASSYMNPALNLENMEKRLTLQHEIDMTFFESHGDRLSDFKRVLERLQPSLGYDFVGIFVGDNCYIAQDNTQPELLLETDPLLRNLKVLVESHRRELYCSSALLKPDQPVRLSETLNVAGLLAIHTQLMPELIVFFAAKELVKKVSWGGKPNTVSITEKNGERHLTPRGSFDLWQEQVTGESEEWTQLDKDLLKHLYDKFLEKAISVKNAQVREELYNSAYRDPLSKLYNRRYIDLFLKEKCQYQSGVEAMSLLFVDLDNFKRVNDFLSHDAGDHLIVKVAERLLRCIRPDDLVVRLGGDEFIVIIVHRFADVQVNKEIAVTVAKKISREVGQPVAYKDYQILTTPSIGIVTREAGLFDLTSVLQCADIAMYKAKQSGKNSYYVFDEKDKLAVVEEGKLESDLRDCVNRNCIGVVFQPQFNLEGEQLVGCEVLARWEHSQLGSINPEKFIALAEKVGLIHQLGFQIINKACETAKRWLAVLPANMLPSMSVNISATQLFDPGFCRELLATVSRHGIDPDFLCLEITESIFITDFDQAIRLLGNLKDSGFRFSLDDFGTGYSSLSYLQKLPVDEVKIDKSFIQSMASDTTSLTMVESIVNLCKKLALDIVAEGVEEQVEVALLKSFHCDIAQGYYYARPLSPEVFYTTYLSTKQYASS